jgi:LmbE family N-acetylglucosaminyl deacetylase
VNNKSAYLVTFSPHPVDTEWGIAGTVAKWTKEGKDVLYVVCTDGVQSSDIKMKLEEKAKIREQEQLAAAKILGVKEVIFLRYPCLNLEYTPKFRQDILRVILAYRPEVVATCDPYSPKYLSNPDHRATGRAVLDAVWPCALALNTSPELVKEGFKPHMVKEILLWAPETANYRSDVSATFEIKMAAIRCHKSQVGDPVNPAYGDRLIESAKKAAEGENFRLAEAFNRIEVPQRL